MRPIFWFFSIHRWRNQMLFLGTRHDVQREKIYRVVWVSDPCIGAELLINMLTWQESQQTTNRHRKFGSTRVLIAGTVAAIDDGEQCSTQGVKVLDSKPEKFRVPKRRNFVRNPRLGLTGQSIYIFLKNNGREFGHLIRALLAGKGSKTTKSHIYCSTAFVIHCICRLYVAGGEGSRRFESRNVRKSFGSRIQNWSRNRFRNSRLVLTGIDEFIL